ncbi:DUF2634 domain-containing protein [Pseudobacillus wudalianchiensis]|uniref:DUF2634 domain-containing protein n=1 Tax=Pseudobacillus wudalianchiensis TaxID=1743143 RepID=A0A1B9ATN4_9BACI|nr:DUF2634 domain-containing protein [Bacillus wudalianchiensis]OCA87285.1 hypothetical protein A8F95_08540 [Bacillus wudalianchiensis]
MALIPENILEIEADAEVLENQEAQTANGESDYYIDFENGRWTSQKITGQDKGVQWLKIGCMTEKYEYTIYDEFGALFERLIEEQLPREIIEGEIARAVVELAQQHEELRNATTTVEFKGKKAFIDIKVNGQEERVVIGR